MLKLILVIVGIIIAVAVFQKGVDMFKEQPMQSSFEATKTIYSTAKGFAKESNISDRIGEQWN